MKHSGNNICHILVKKAKVKLKNTRGMKYSIYNNKVSICNGFGIFYNSMSDRFLVLKGNNMADIDRLSADSLKQTNADLYAKLVSINGIVSNNCNEVAMLENLIKKLDNDDSAYILHINPTLDCNFRCWYCYENHVKGSKMNDGMVEKVKMLITRIISGNDNLKTLQLSFFGGEPLLHFNEVARPIITFAKEETAKNDIALGVHFTTNAFLLSKMMFDFFDGLNISFQITIDGDQQRHDQTRFCTNGKGSYKTIIGNIRQLAERGHHVIMRINYTSKNISGIENVIEEIGKFDCKAKQNIHIDLQQVWQDVNNDKQATDCQARLRLQEARSKGIFTTSCKTFDRVRNACYGDKRNHAVINYNGDVFQCTARDFNKNNRSGYLSDDGRIIYENDALNKRMSIKLSRDVCKICSIAPLCGGGCTQQAIESRNIEGCIYGMGQNEIRKAILDRFEYKFISK